MEMSSRLYDPAVLFPEGQTSLGWLSLLHKYSRGPGLDSELHRSAVSVEGTMFPSKHYAVQSKRWRPSLQLSFMFNYYITVIRNMFRPNYKKPSSG